MADGLTGVESFVTYPGDLKDSVRDHDDGLSGVNTPPQSGKVKLEGVVRDFSERFTVK